MVALASLIVVGTMSASIAYFTTANQTSGIRDRTSASVDKLAEAGLQAALSHITSQMNFTSPDAPQTGTLKGPTSIVPANQILFPSCNGNPAPTPVHIPFTEVNGSVDYCADLQTVNDTESDWLVKSTASVANSGHTVRKTLTQTIKIYGAPATGDDISAWTRFFQNDNTTCLTIDHVDMPASIATRGPLCLTDGASISGAASTVDVGGSVSIQGRDTPSGPRVPTAGSGTSWTTPTNVYASDSSYATYNVASGSSSNALTASGFGFTIPATAIIRGIEVDVVHKASATSSVRDSSVYLQKTNSATAGTNHGVTTYWGTTDSTKTYGTNVDLWGTTWTAAEINASTFGVRVAASNTSGSSKTAYINQVTVTVTYTADTPGNIGASGAPVSAVNVAGSPGCTFNANSPHNPCGNADHVWATTITSTPPADNLVMPTVDLPTWFQGAKPGPKHGCTNTGTNLAPLQFDNDNSSVSNNSVHYDNTTEDMTPDDRSYTCRVVENGITIGELSWDLPNRVLTVSGTIFFDGDVRFDSDGAVVHYHGRALIYAAGNVEFDELVCAGGTGTAACYPNMSNWNADQNYLVIMSGGDSEYDQGGTNCPNSQYGRLCPSGYTHPVSGFQGVVAASGQCLIHERFQLSGPVLCQNISLPYESDGWPTYYPFSIPTTLVNGQQYVAMSQAHAWTITPGSTS